MRWSTQLRYSLRRQRKAAGPTALLRLAELFDVRAAAALERLEQRNRCTAGEGRTVGL